MLSKKIPQFLLVGIIFFISPFIVSTEVQSTFTLDRTFEPGGYKTGCNILDYIGVRNLSVTSQNVNILCPTKFNNTSNQCLSEFWESEMNLLSDSLKIGCQGVPDITGTPEFGSQEYLKKGGYSNLTKAFEQYTNPPTSAPIDAVPTLSATQQGLPEGQTVPGPGQITWTPTPSPLPDSFADTFGNMNIEALGTEGNACWIRLDVVPKDVQAAPDWVPNLLGLREKINNTVGSLIGIVNNALTRNSTNFKGPTLCDDPDNHAVLTDENGIEINDNYNNNEEIAKDFELSVMDAWDNENWAPFNVGGKYEDYSCKCVRDTTPIGLTASNSSSPISANVAGASTGRVLGTKINVTSSEWCLAAQTPDDKNKCIAHHCSYLEDRAKIANCVSCLSGDGTYIEGIKDDKYACVSSYPNIQCMSLLNNSSESEFGKCVECMEKGKGVWTAIGCLYSDLQKTINEQLFGLLIGIGGVSVLGCIIFAAFRMQTSAGNPEQVKAAQDMATSCITGLIIIIFSVFILRVIGVDIIRIPFLS